MEIDAAGNLCFFFCLSASFPLFFFFLFPSNSDKHIPACTHTHARKDLHKMHRTPLFISQSCAQTFTQDWKSLVYRPWCDSRIREWTGSDASHWTPDLHSHLCPLSSPSALSPDVCSQLNRSHSTTAAAYPEQVKGFSFPLGSLINRQELHERYDAYRTNKLHYLYKEATKIHEE